jgi:IS30 family transposase
MRAPLHKPVDWAARISVEIPNDQGKKMARHQQLATETGIKIYFADPHATLISITAKQ